MPYTYYTDPEDSDDDFVLIECVSSLPPYSTEVVTDTIIRRTKHSHPKLCDASLNPASEITITVIPASEFKADGIDTSRAAGDHDFLVANMFGPVDWEASTSDDKDAAEDGVLTALEAGKAYRPFEAGKRSYVCEANMFGPMDWALEVFGLGMEEDGNAGGHSE